MGEFKIRELSLLPGKYGRVDIPVCQMAGGYTLRLPLHVAHGAHPGPRLLLLAAIHGEEIFAVDVIREVFRRVDREALRGTVLAIPVANPPSLEWRTRNTPIDMLNLNRVFPGKATGWISERIASVLSEVVKDTECIVDVDGGSSERVIHYVYVKRSSGSWGRQVEELSRVFGLELLYRGPFFEGSVSAYAEKLGIPCIVPEIGGSLLYLDNRFLEEGVVGVFNVMRHLGMLEGVGANPPVQYVITERMEIRVSQGGIFHPLVGLEALNRPLPKATPLAVITDPYSLEDIAVIETPWDEAVLLQMRVLTSTVQPGDYAYIIGNRANAEKIGGS